MEESAGRLSEEPASPELAAARAAFDRGDFLETRRVAGALAGRPDVSDATRAAARELLDALQSDRLAIGLGVGCVIFFVLTVWLTLFR